MFEENLLKVLFTYFKLFLKSILNFMTDWFTIQIYLSGKAIKVQVARINVKLSNFIKYLKFKKKKVQKIKVLKKFFKEMSSLSFNAKKYNNLLVLTYFASYRYSDQYKINMIQKSRDE